VRPVTWQDVISSRTMRMSHHPITVNKLSTFVAIFERNSIQTSNVIKYGADGAS